MDENFKKAIKEIANFLGKKLDAISAEIKGLASKRDDININQSVSANTEALEKQLAELTSSITRELSLLPTKIQIPAIPTPQIPTPQINVTEQKVDQTKLINAFKQVEKAILNNKPESNKDIQKLLLDVVNSVKSIPEIDTASLEKKLDVLVETLQKSNKNLSSSLTKALAEGFKKEVTLSDSQLKAIVHSNKGGGFVSPQLVARSSIVDSVTMTSADTEYSFTFPKHTVKWRMKLRAIGADFKYAWITGKLPGSGDDSDYITIPVGWLDSQEGEYGGKTIYFESATAGQVMEFEIGQA